jgi:hypothetical protein
VLNHSILAGQVLAEMEDGRRILIDAGDVLAVISRGSGDSAPARPTGEKRGRHREE